MCALKYNGVKPQNIKPFYTANDIVDFTCQLQPGRAVKAGSFRISGWLNVQKIVPGTTAAIPLTKDDAVFMSPYAGVHSFWRNSTCYVNARTLEVNTMYPRWASMEKQSKYTLEGINTSSAGLTELCGSQNDVLLLGSEIAPNTPQLPNVTGSPLSIPFSFKPEVALNKSSGDLGESRFGMMKMLFNLASAVEALYSTNGETWVREHIGQLQYQFMDLQLQWYETIETPSSEPITFQTVNLITQTLVSSNASFAVSSPTVYDAVSLSFIQQAHRNAYWYDNYACEYITGLENVGSRIEFTVSGGDQPIRFPIQTYSECALNYFKSMNGDIKNSMMNVYGSQNGCFGIGCKFVTGINDRLAVNLILQGTVTPNPSVSPSDTYIYVSGYITL